MDNSFDHMSAGSLNADSDCFPKTTDAGKSSFGAGQYRMDMYWHYTPWAYLPAIVESGELRVGNAWATHEMRMLWFSANQHWEPTATKRFRPEVGKVFVPTFTQLVNLMGCVRFGLSVADSRLLKWKDACTVAGLPRGLRRSMEKVGKREGGDPAHWFATATNIPLTELHFQVWCDTWCEATSPQDMAEAWVKARGNQSIAAG